MTAMPPRRTVGRTTPSFASVRTGYYPPDPGLLYGRSSVSVLSWAFVLLAVMADLVAFYTVLELLFRSSPLIVLLGTVGFTAVAVGIAHATGVAYKQRRCADRRGAGLWAGFAVWLALGALAFFVRWYNTPLGATLGGASFFPSSAGQPAPAGPDRALLAALLFVALFAASGLLAGLAGYHHHHPDAVARRGAARMRAATALPREDTLSTLEKLRGAEEALLAALEQASEHRVRMRKTTDSSVRALQHRAREFMARGRQPEEVEDLFATPVDEVRRPSSAAAEDE